MSEEILKDDEIGVVKVSDDVVSVISSLAASEIKGIRGIAQGNASGIGHILSKKNVSKGVKVTVGEDETTIDLDLNIEYGYKIPEVAAAVQESVKRSVEAMTGLKVSAVNIKVVGIIMPREEAKPEETAKN